MNISTPIKFTILGVLLNALIVFAAARWPDWASGLFLSKDGPYSHFVSTKYLIDGLIILAIIIFIIHIIFAIRYINMTMSRICFQIAYDISSIRIIRALLTLTAGSIFAVSVGYLAKSTISYGYALAKEVRHADTANWNWRVAKGNEALIKGDLEGAIVQFKGAIEGPGQTLDEVAVDRMKERLERLRQSAGLSNTLLGRAIQMEASGQMHVAAEFYRQSLSIFQHNTATKRRLNELKKRFEEARVAGQDFFALCNQRRLDLIVTRSSEFVFFVRNSASLVRNAGRLTAEQQARSLWTTCTQVRQFSSFSEYYTDVERTIFQRDAIQEAL